MYSNHALVEAVDRLRKAEKEFEEARTEVADLLEIAAKTQQVTRLAELTKINRTTIYWLIRTWSTKNANPNNGYQRKEST